MVPRAGSSLPRAAAAFGVLTAVLFLAQACAPAETPKIEPAVMVSSTATRDLPSPSPAIAPSIAPSPTETARPIPLFPAYPHIFIPDPVKLQTIFTHGIDRGCRAGVFSKVGDSITANNGFLVPFGKEGYSLGDYAALQDVISHYSGVNARLGNSFVNSSLAAKGGWRSADVLNPEVADPICEPGESPLACEVRLVRPCVAVIMLGTNDVALAVGDYAANMDAIVRRLLGDGVIPMLTTIPFLTGWDVGPYNQAVEALSAEFGIPLIDLFAALKTLPGYGLAGDGIHLSWANPGILNRTNLTYGMNVRNLLTLEALDAVWKITGPILQ